MGAEAHCGFKFGFEFLKLVSFLNPLFQIIVNMMKEIKIIIIIIIIIT